jgi:hypothetical protein
MLATMRVLQTFCCHTECRANKLSIDACIQLYRLPVLGEYMSSITRDKLASYERGWLRQDTVIRGAK